MDLSRALAYLGISRAMGAGGGAQRGACHAQLPKRDYGIDAGEVLSMNVETVETSGVDAQTPDFAQVVNSWETYGQKTFSAAFGDKDGNILERANGERVGTLPATDPISGISEVTKEPYVLARYSNVGERTVVSNVPAGLTAKQLMSDYGLSGFIFSDVNAGWTYGEDIHKNAYANGKRLDNYGWWGTALLNPNEYDADNIRASFKVVKGGSLNEGFAFNVSKNDKISYQPVGNSGEVYDSSLWVNPISGYFWNVSHHGNSTQHILFKAENWRLDNSFSANYAGNGPLTDGSGNLAVWCSPQAGWCTPGGSITTQYGEKITCLARWEDDGSDIDYSLDSSAGRIRIWETDNGEERLVADVLDDTFTKGTYGFWGNNCEQRGQAQISNLNVAITKTKSFGDIVYEPAWTDGALHMLINMDTLPDSISVEQIDM